MALSGNAKDNERRRQIRRGDQRPIRVKTEKLGQSPENQTENTSDAYSTGSATSTVSMSYFFPTPVDS
jgi:hypothetical protein